MTTSVQEILRALPITDLARRLDAGPEQVQRAAAAVVPALLGGLQAHAADPDGAVRVLDALRTHQGQTLSGAPTAGADPAAAGSSRSADAADVTVGGPGHATDAPSGVGSAARDLASGATSASAADGDRGVATGGPAVQAAFGDRTDEVVRRLGTLEGVEPSLVERLLPLLAPGVLGWVAGEVDRQAAAGGSQGRALGGREEGGLDQAVLTDILGTVLARATGDGGFSSRPSDDYVQAQGFDTRSVITRTLAGVLGRESR